MTVNPLDAARRFRDVLKLKHQLLHLKYLQWSHKRAVRHRKEAEKERKRIEARCEGVDELPLSTTLYEIARGLYFYIKWLF